MGLNVSDAPWLRWWFYNHGRFVAEHPTLVFLFGSVLLGICALGLLNPAGKPFTFSADHISFLSIDSLVDASNRFNEDVRKIFSVQVSTDWPLLMICCGACLIHIFFITDFSLGTDWFGFLPSWLRRLVLGPVLQLRRSAANDSSRDGMAPLGVRLLLGFTGVVTVLASILMSVSIAHSLLGIEMNKVLTELPFLVLLSGFDNVFLLLRTLRWKSSQSFSDVNQMAIATSHVGPEVTLFEFSKFLIFVVGSVVWNGPNVSDFFVHAGIAALAKSLLQVTVMSVIVQKLLPFCNKGWKLESMKTPEIRCRICFESDSQVKRCPCKCRGSMGWVHRECFENWLAVHRSLRCEVCRKVFQIRMEDASFWNVGALVKVLHDSFWPLLKWFCVIMGLQVVLWFNKLGMVVFDVVKSKLPTYVTDTQMALGTVGIAGFISLVAATCLVWPSAIREYRRSHRVVTWDPPVPSSVDDDVSFTRVPSFQDISELVRSASRDSLQSLDPDQAEEEPLRRDGDHTPRGMGLSEQQVAVMRRVAQRSGSPFPGGDDE